MTKVEFESKENITIHTTQTGFLENRSIVNNVITFWEYSAWAEEQEVDLAVMLLDFEKA